MGMRAIDKNYFLPPVLGSAVSMPEIPPLPGPAGAVEVAGISLVWSAFILSEILRGRKRGDEQFGNLVHEYERRGYSRLDAVRFAHARLQGRKTPEGTVDTVDVRLDPHFFLIPGYRRVHSEAPSVTLYAAKPGFTPPKTVRPVAKALPRHIWLEDVPVEMVRHPNSVGEDLNQFPEGGMEYVPWARLFRTVSPEVLSNPEETANLREAVAHIHTRHPLIVVFIDLGESGLAQMLEWLQANPGFSGQKIRAMFYRSESMGRNSAGQETRGRVLVDVVDIDLQTKSRVSLREADRARKERLSGTGQ